MYTRNTCTLSSSLSLCTCIDYTGTTTAAISLIIPNIAYTPETYSVKYTGVILQATQATSIIRRGFSNIATINQEFTIMLTGLEEDNTYTYTVDSTNCLGTCTKHEWEMTQYMYCTACACIVLYDVLYMHTCTYTLVTCTKIRVFGYVHVHVNQWATM